MIETLNTGTRVARKNYQCWHCYRPIEKWTEYSFGTFKYDHVYTLKYHADCERASWFHFRRIGQCDYGDGYPPLLDSVQDGDGQIDAEMRGKFPHVACRLEFHAQKGSDE